MEPVGTGFVLVAPTAFKGTISAADAAAAMAAGAKRFASDAGPAVSVVELPLSDGGPGLLDALGRHTRTLRPVEVSGPLGDLVTARVVQTAEEVVFESADACGMHLLPANRLDPLRADSRGVGELFLAARPRDDDGRSTSRRIIMGLGGSATVDGGVGMASALGWRFLDAWGRDLPPGGGSLASLRRIVPVGRREGAVAPAGSQVTALADVRTPLIGPAGAARVFAPQKGADAAAVGTLEEGLERLTDCIEADLGLRLGDLPGGGAAGGLGAGVIAFLGGRLVPGADWVLRRTRFDELLRGAVAVVTGEGAYDAQSSLGKVSGEVLARARALDLPVLVIAGHVDAPLPPGVIALDGGGGTLGSEDLATLCEQGLRQLLSHGSRD